jgi:hypothetical protein
LCNLHFQVFVGRFGWLALFRGNVVLLLQGKEGIVIAVRDGLFYIGKCDCNKPEQQTPLCAKGLAQGAYWYHGGDEA